MESRSRSHSWLGMFQTGSAGCEGPSGVRSALSKEQQGQPMLKGRDGPVFRGTDEETQWKTSVLL